MIHQLIYYIFNSKPFKDKSENDNKRFRDLENRINSLENKSENLELEVKESELSKPQRANFYSSSNIFGISSLFIGIVTAIILYKQTKLIEDQQKELRRQSRFLIGQDIQTRRSSNAEALSSLIADIEAQRRNASNDQIDKYGRWTPSKNLLFRIVVVSQSLTPYDSTGNKNVILSKERGYLLLTLTKMNMKFPLNPNPNFEFANLKNVDLSYISLRGANLRGADFTGADLTGADLGGADLNGAYFNNAKLHFANFSPGPIKNGNDEPIVNGTELYKANFTNAELAGIKIDSSCQYISVNREIILFVPYALNEGGQLVYLLDGTPYADSLQKPELYHNCANK